MAARAALVQIIKSSDGTYFYVWQEWDQVPVPLRVALAENQGLLTAPTVTASSSDADVTAAKSGLAARLDDMDAA